jgi:uncharacterized membrane protein
MKTTLRISAVLFLVFLSQQTFACINCNRPLQDAIFDANFWPNLLKLLSPFPIAMLAIGMITRNAGPPGHSINTTGNSDIPGQPGTYRSLTAGPLISAATVLGVGMGGFVDGILLHQILQWHEMVSNIIPPTTVIGKSINMFWDGMFHAATWIITFIGVIMLFRLSKRTDVVKSSSIFAGGLLLGWAIFNIVEGIIDHYILKLHNVREITSNPSVYNHAFTVFSLSLFIVGLVLIKREKRQQQ